MTIPDDSEAVMEARVAQERAIATARAQFRLEAAHAEALFRHICDLAWIEHSIVRMRYGNRVEEIRRTAGSIDTVRQSKEWQIVKASADAYRAAIRNAGSLKRKTIDVATTKLNTSLYEAQSEFARVKGYIKR